VHGESLVTGFRLSLVTVEDGHGMIGVCYNSATTTLRQPHKRNTGSGIKMPCSWPIKRHGVCMCAGSTR
jgi:hypothetical protein